MHSKRREFRPAGRLFGAIFAATATAALAQTALPPVAPSYADLVDMTLAAPVIAHATIDKTQALTAGEAGPVAPGTVRMLVGANVLAALRAPSDIPTRISYLWDSPADAKGRTGKVKGVAVLLFARGVDGKPEQFQLIGPQAQLPWSAATEAGVRAILTEAASGSVPVVTGIASAFRVPGGVPGEAESQFFLTTANGKPVSLVLLTRPGEAQKLSVALGDVIDDSAGGVRRDTLLWYRLACFLPPDLPAGVGGDDRAGLAADYGAVIKLLGPCGRSAAK
jgi:hypothetical protein